MLTALSGIPLLVMLSSTQAPADARDTLRLSLPEARELARLQAPIAQLADARLEAARGAALSAATYPYNPQAELKAAQLFNPGGSGGFEAIFSQELEWAGQIGLRRSVGRSAEAAAGGEHSDVMRLFMAEVEGAHHRLAAATRKAQVSEEAVRLTGTLGDAVAAQLRAGQVSMLEANLAEIQAARSEADLLAIRAEVAAASAALARVLGLDPTTAIRAESVESRVDAVPLDELEALLAEAAQARPDLTATASRLEEAESRSRLARRRVVPNLAVGAVLSRSNQLEPTAFGLKVSIGVPFWDRNQGARRESAALVRVAEEQRRDAELAVQAEVVAAWERAKGARESIALYETRVLQPARSNRTLLERARAEGRIDLPTMLVLQTQLIDAELGYWDLWLEAQLAETALRAAVARNV